MPLLPSWPGHKGQFCNRILHWYWGLKNLL